MERNRDIEVELAFQTDLTSQINFHGADTEFLGTDLKSATFQSISVEDEWKFKIAMLGLEGDITYSSNLNATLNPELSYIEIPDEVYLFFLND